MGLDGRSSVIMYIVPYRGTFKGENFHELVKDTNFANKTFADCLLLPCQRMPYPQISRIKLS